MLETADKAPNGESVDIQRILEGAQASLQKIKEAETSAASAAASIEESRKLSTEALTATQTKLEESSNVATLAAAAKAQINDAQAVIATKSDHIQKAQEHADKVRADLDRALTAATQQVTAAEGHQAKAQSEAEAAAKLVADLRVKKSAIEADAGAISAARKSAEEATVVTKSLAEKSGTIEKRVSEYEALLVALEKQCQDQLKTIESLLPGATSAGLAHAFDKRRHTFLSPQKRWQLIFIGSVSLIVVLTFMGLWHTINSPTIPTFQELIRLWLTRLPVVAALVWLAMHASRESALAKRLEEDYGYKAAIATCFEGFKKQLSEVGGAVNPESALAILLKNTLATIATPPGRIYDMHKLAVSPSDEISQTLKAIAEAGKAVKPAGLDKP